MAGSAAQHILETLNCIPRSQQLLTACYEDVRSAALVTMVQVCSEDPPMIMLSMAKGLAVESLIRDSRRFALCMLPSDDRFICRKFAKPPDRWEDPLVSLPTRCSRLGLPVLTRAMCYLDCELALQIDLEAPTRLYVADVRHAEMLRRSKNHPLSSPETRLDDGSSGSNGHT